MEINEPADQVVMLEVQDGAVEKLSILFERHHRMLFHFFQRMTSNPTLSEDLVQEVFLRVLRFRHTFRGESQFTTWMYQIARNAAMDHFRKRKNEKSWDEEDMEEPVSQEPGHADKMEQDEETILLREALSRLPAEKRELLILSRYQGLKYEQIAGILSTNVATVKVRVYRAVKELGEIFFRLQKVRAS